MKRSAHPFPEVYCDLNTRMTTHGFSLERNGSMKDLAKLELTLASAVVLRFTFVMDDEDDDGTPDDIMFNGVVIHDPEWGYLALMDEDGTYHRSELS